MAQNWTSERAYALAKLGLHKPRAGLNATEVLAALRAAHAEGRVAAGLDVGTGQARDLAEDGIVDLYQTKWWALRLAADAAVTVLKVDQIIMVRRL